MDGPIQSDPFIEINGFKHIRHQQLIAIKNFQKDLLTFCPEQSTVTFESDINPKSRFQLSGAVKWAQGGRAQDEEYVEKGELFLDTYDELSGHNNGLPVVISYRIVNRNYIVCVEDDSVTIKESELPDIPSENSEFIFYRKDSVSEDTMTCSTFESSVKRGFFLACREDGRNLILKPHAEDEVDETTIFLITYSTVLGFKYQKLHENIPYHIRNSHDDFLIAHPEECIANFELDGDAKGEQAKFYMNIYKELASNDGVPVIFSCKVDNKNYLLCAASDSVIVKESELPAEISTETSEFIFYVKEFSNGHSAYRFESSLKFEPPLQQRFCLAWNWEDPKKKLILKPYRAGGINEGINFFIEAKNTE